jgi:hypothetical protein
MYASKLICVSGLALTALAAHAGIVDNVSATYQLTGNGMAMGGNFEFMPAQPYDYQGGGFPFEVDGFSDHWRSQCIDPPNDCVMVAAAMSSGSAYARAAGQRLELNLGMHSDGTANVGYHGSQYAGGFVSGSNGTVTINFSLDAPAVLSAEPQSAVSAVMVSEPPASYGLNATARFTLADSAGGTIYEVLAAPAIGEPAQVLPIDFAGLILPAGDYRITMTVNAFAHVFASSFAVFAGSTAQVQATLETQPINCPADYDRSGFVDSDDFTLFVSDFIEGCPAAGAPGLINPGYTCAGSADFDRSTFVDSDDFASFVTAFNTPC